MKTSPNRILTTHVGSLPCPESIKTLLCARLSGQTIDEAQLCPCPRGHYRGCTPAG